jgi:tetratricopeptide (TPR) repeat protein
MIAARTGRSDLAIRLLGEVISLEPRSVDARIELATALRASGNVDQAIAVCQQAIRLEPNDAGTHNHLGVCYLNARRLPEAAACFEHAIALKPDVALFHYHLGQVRQIQCRDKDAADLFRTAVGLAPDLAEAHVRLGQLMANFGARDEAARCFAHARTLRGDSAPARLMLARVFAEVGQFEAAIDCAREVLAIDPKANDAHQLLGEVLQQLGRFDQAIASFGQVLVAQPRRTEAYLGIGLSKRLTEADDAMLARMSALLGEVDLPNRDRANLHYGLGKASDDRGHYEDAMRHFDEANRIAAAELRRSGRTIDRRRHAGNIDRLISTFTPDFFARRAALGSASDLPVFIVGMIRSGTTLAEQIVSSHPAVGAGGELRFWGDRGAQIAEVQTGALADDAAGKLAATYCRLLGAMAPGATRVTDKMPTNFLLLGMIHLILPRARVIHCRRHPVDNLLSMYFTPYTRSPDYAHDRGNLVFYYQQYLRLMAHWRAVLPGDRLLEVDYEDVVADRERAARRIIDFCGLPWDAACLQPERNTRPIATPSLWQARQPVYRTAVARWRHYERWLGEFRRLLPTVG